MGRLNWRGDIELDRICLPFNGRDLERDLIGVRLRRRSDGGGVCEIRLIGRDKERLLPREMDLTRESDRLRDGGLRGDTLTILRLRRVRLGDFVRFRLRVRLGDLDLGGRDVSLPYLSLKVRG